MPFPKVNPKKGQLALLFGILLFITSCSSKESNKEEFEEFAKEKPTLNELFVSGLSQEEKDELKDQTKYREDFLSMDEGDEQRLELIGKFNGKNAVITFNKNYEKLSEEEIDKFILTMYLSKDPSVAYSALVEGKVINKKHRDLLIGNLNSNFGKKLIESKIITSEEEIQNINNIINL